MDIASLFLLCYLKSVKEALLANAVDKPVLFSKLVFSCLLISFSLYDVLRLPDRGIKEYRSSKPSHVNFVL